MKISVIIPAYNESEHIGKLVAHLQLHGAAYLAEIIVADGGSTDQTALLAEESGALVVHCPERGRSRQMNFGAARASGEVLYFVHADTLPPATYAKDLLSAVQDGYDLGRYRSRFLSPSPILRVNEFFTRFDFFICMGGDQTLFIRHELFNALGCFNPELLIMEEYEFCTRPRKRARYKIFNSATLISARKYEKNGWLRGQKANYEAVRLYRGGAAQDLILQTYRRMLR